MVESKYSSLGIMFMLFIGIIVALAILPTIANAQGKMTDKLEFLNDTGDLTTCYAAGSWGEVNTSNSACNVTLTENPTTWKTSKCPVSSVVVTNASGDALTITTDYTVDTANGIVSYLNTTATSTNGTVRTVGGNKTYVTYDYCDDGYVTESAGRSITRLITLFAALGLVAFAIVVAMKKLNE